VGTYDLTAESAGFSVSHSEALTLDVSQTRRVEFKLVPSGTNETAVVTATPPLLNTSDASLAGLVSEEQVETLPLNGRSIQNLVMLQPGMAQDSGSMGWLSPQWISNGNRGETEVVTLDGSDATDAEMGTVQFWNFNLDAIAEFKVQQANYSAEFGQGAGTITQMVSKSGTNQFHGSAFEFIRNSALDAKNFFSQTGVAPFQRNEFGVTVGGPVLRDKLFFFGEWAGLRQELGEPTGLIVPTQAERQGLISWSNGYTYQVPLNSTAQTILSKYPLPNLANASAGAVNFSEQFKAPTTVNQYSVRIDYHISDKDSVMGRASYINNTALETDPVAAIESPDFSAAQMNDPRNFAITETHVFTPNLINVGIVTLNRQIEANIPPSQEYTQTDFDDGSLSNWGPDTFITKYVENYLNPSDKITWVKGKHVLSMGVEGRYGQDDGFGVTGAGPNGNYAFNYGIPTPVSLQSTNGGPAIAAGTPTPSGLVTMMLGLPSTFGRSSALPGFGSVGGGLGPHWGIRVWHAYSYVQDDYRVTPKLTLNLGVRYEYTSVPYEIRDRLGAVEDSGPLAGSFVLNPQPLYSPQKANFAPRLGAAYRLDEKTVLRGGFAIFTNSIPTVYPDQAAVNLPMASLSLLNNPTYSLTPLPVSLPAITSTSGAVEPPSGGTTKIPGNTPVNLLPIANVIGLISGDFPSTRLKNGYTMTGNFTLERQLPGDIAMQATYVTNNSSNLYNGGYPNFYNGAAETPLSNVTPGLGEVQLFYNQGLFHYNSLQVQARKISPTHGISYQASYSWSRNLTDSDSIFSASGANGGISLNDPTCIKCEYARASFDLGQRFVANVSYNVPGRWGIVPERLSKGWQTLGIFSSQTGFPFSILETYGTVNYGYDSFNGVGVRPDYVKPLTKSFSGTQNNPGSVQYFSGDVIQNTGNYFASNTVQVNNPQSPSEITALTPNPLPTQTAQLAPGTLGRNTATGPGWWNADFSLVKDTKITESINFQFRSEFFNVFNHATFATPNGVIGNPNFGLITSTASAERQIQFGGRFVF